MVTGLLFTYFVVFPAIGGVFIGGFLAPRASWLVGVVIGLVSAVCYVALGVSGLLPTPFAEQFTVNALGASVSAFIYSPIMGAFFAAAAAWYRRFLALSSPNRNRNEAVADPEATPRRRPNAHQLLTKGPRQALRVLEDRRRGRRRRAATALRATHLKVRSRGAGRAFAGTVRRTIVGHPRRRIPA